MTTTPKTIQIFLPGGDPRGQDAGLVEAADAYYPHR